MATFYYKFSGGNDGGAGTIGDPYKNIEGPSGISTLTLARGDTVYLACGDRWRGQKATFPAVGGGAGQCKLTWYGSGAFPIIDGTYLFQGIIPALRVFSNEGFETWSGGVPTSWNWELPSGGAPTSTLTQEGTVVHAGSSAVKFNIGAVETPQLRQSTTSLSDMKTYRVAFYTAPGTFTASEAVALLVWRSGGSGAAEYYDFSTNQWTQTGGGGLGGKAITLGDFNEDSVYVHTEDTFFTGRNILGHTTYNVALITKTTGVPVGKYWYLDSFTIGEANTTSTNLVTDPLFEDWEGDLNNQDNWRYIKKGLSVLEDNDDVFAGVYGVALETDSEDSDVGLEQKNIALEAKTYQIGCFHHFIDTAANDTGYVGLQLIRESDGWFHNGTEWVEAEADFLCTKHSEWDIMYDEITISAAGNYTIKVHRGYGKSVKQYERLYVDAVFIKEKDADKVYRAHCPETPKYLYVSGAVWGLTADMVQLKEVSSTTTPPPFCWSVYGDEIFINLETDPYGLDIEGSVKDYNIDTSGESYIDLYQLVCRGAHKDGILLKHGTASAPTSFNVSGCFVYDAAFSCYQIGYRPDPPAIGGAEPSIAVGYTPENVVIDSCYAWRYARDRTIRIVTAGKSYYNGYIVPKCGIFVSPGANNPGVGADSTYKKNVIFGDLPSINYSAGRNGIAVMHGEDVRVEYNLITKSDHAITANGTQSGGVGRCSRVEIVYNHVRGTGDDGMWITGTTIGGTSLKGSVAAYNIIEDSGDNCLDIANAIWVECYNNIFINNVNEMIPVWGYVSWGGETVMANAFILNNIFIDWGRDGWRSVSYAKARGCAIGFYSEESAQRSRVEGNTFYHRDTTSNVNKYAFHVAEVQKTLDEMIATYGYPTTNKTEKPMILDAVSSPKDTRLGNDSPCLNDGINLSAYTGSIQLHESNELLWTPYVFNSGAVFDDLIHHDSVWPLLVTHVAQGSQIRSTGQWNRGAWSTMEYRVVDLSSPFPTDKSLIGLPVYVVNQTDKKIWRGKISSNTSSKVYVDSWVGVFNTSGELPYGVLSYYVGGIFVYDKTGIFAPLNESLQKLINEAELHTSHPDEQPDILFKMLLDDGNRSTTGIFDQESSRVRSPRGDAYCRNVQLEHAFMAKQKLAVKTISVGIEWAQGLTDPS